MPVRNLKLVNTSGLYNQAVSAISQTSHVDTAKISPLFRKQIPPGQHNCSERDMTRNEKPLNLVLSLTLMSTEDLWVSLPGQCSH